MAAHSWGTDRSVDETLFRDGHRFDFYQAVRLLEILRPKRTPVGETADGSGEIVRFKSKVGLDFPATDVDEVRSTRESDQPEMVVNFMGIAGVHGPMPNPITELIVDRVFRKDTAFRDFLDIFNHRLLSLMYRVRKTHRLGVDTRRPEDRPFARYLFSLIGLGTKNLKDRMGVKDRALLYYSGILAMKPRSGTGLETLLADYFKVRVRLKPLTGQWHRLEADQITVLGRNGRNQRLGQTAVIGTRVWDQQGRFTLVVGPLKIREFTEFLPTGERFRPLSELTRFYAGRELDFDVRLQLRAEEVPASRLGTPEGPRLGWTAWLRTGTHGSDLAEVVLHPGA
jgi:type VI secretion system protein ImpH